jgi:hypothetical protein
MTGNEANPTDVDRWISAVIHGPRELAYQLGRLFNRFCFHVDQSNVASYDRVFDHKLVYENQLGLAKNAVREIERQAQLFDPGNDRLLAPIRECRERFEDGTDFHIHYERLSERCGMLESDPSLESLLNLGAPTKDWLRSILLELLGKHNEAVFKLGHAVDKAICPGYAAERIDSMRGRLEHPLERTLALGFGAGQLPPDSGWLQLVASLLVEGNCETTPPTEIPDAAGPEL